MSKNIIILISLLRILNGCLKTTDIPDERGPVKCPQTIGPTYHLIFYNKNHQVVYRLEAASSGCKLVTTIREKNDSDLLVYPIGGNRTWDNQAGHTFWEIVNSIMAEGRS